MPCLACGNEKVVARGLCNGCYARRRRNGTVARKYVINTGECSIHGCGKPSLAKNLCLTHYEDSRHPLRHLWASLRSRNKGAYPQEWDKFERFLADVGERPGPAYQFRRIDASRPFAKDNFKWLPPIGGPQSMTKAERSVYSREWALNRKFKITSEDYNQILQSQNGACAICCQEETHVYRSGKKKELAVDHCHKTNRIRGLLCFNCNQALGRFKDDPERMKRAIEYLRKE